MKNFIATIGLACCLPTGLAAEDPGSTDAMLGTVDVLVIEESAPLAKDSMCARTPGDKDGAECMVFNRAVLTARIQKVSLLRERGRWM